MTRPAGFMSHPRLKYSKDKVFVLVNWSLQNLAQWLFCLLQTYIPGCVSWTLNSGISLVCFS